MNYMALTLAIILGFAAGWQLKPNPPIPAQKPCPEIVSVVDTIIRQDTIRRIITRERIVHRVDTVYPSGQIENCLSVEDTSNGAYARMTFCSRDLPSERPADLRGTLELVLPPDTQRTYSYLRVDTVQVKVPAPRKWLALTVGPYAGYGIRGVDAGIGINLGFKLKEW